MEIFDTLNPLLKTFWFVAIPTSIIFIIQTIATFVGADSAEGLHTDIDSDFDGSHGMSHLFSLRNLINFMLGFSWAGISFYTTITSKPLLVLFSLVIGVIFLFFFFGIINVVQKLAEDNSFKIESTLFKSADVYLTIPEGKSGKGKIMISINGSVHELDAMTEYEKIPSGAIVKVTEIENNSTVLVEPI